MVSAPFQNHSFRSINGETENGILSSPDVVVKRNTLDSANTHCRISDGELQTGNPDQNMTVGPIV
jgi:hypothetical protein